VVKFFSNYILTRYGPLVQIAAEPCHLFPIKEGGICGSHYIWKLVLLAGMLDRVAFVYLESVKQEREESSNHSP